MVCSELRNWLRNFFRIVKKEKPGTGERRVAVSGGGFRAR